MKKKCFKYFIYFLIIYKIFCLVHIPLKIVPNNQKDVQIAQMYTAQHEHSVQKHPHIDDGSGKVCDLAFFFCESIIFFEIAKFMYEITKVHVYHWQLPRVGIGGIIAKTNLCSVLFPTDQTYIVYCSVGGSCDREGYYGL